MPTRTKKKKPASVKALPGKTAKKPVVKKQAPKPVAKKAVAKKPTQAPKKVVKKQEAYIDPYHPLFLAGAALIVAVMLFGSLSIVPLFGSAPMRQVGDGPTTYVPGSVAKSSATNAAMGDSSAPFIQSRISFANVAKGFGVGGEPRQVVARTAEEWAALQQREPLVASAVTRSPDFTTETVIAVFAGDKGAALRSLEVSHVIQADFETRVYISRMMPAPGCPAATQRAPFHVIVVPKLTGAARFITEDRPLSC